MKKLRKLLLIIVIVEFSIAFILGCFDIRIEPWPLNVVVTCIFLLPIQALLFMSGRNDEYSKKKRTFFKIAFWYLNICYILTVIVTGYTYYS